jgi:hypothetical protein
MTDVDQTAVWDGTQWTVLAPIAGGRNVIINGAMNVWQRGTSFTAASTYTTDRFTVDNGTVTRQTGTGQFPYCLRIANTSINPAIRQGIELPVAGNAGLFTVGSTWTVSFYAKTSTTVTSNLSLYIAFGDTLYSGFTQILSDTSLPVPTTSWVKYSKTFTVGVSPGASNPLMAVVIYLNNGAYAGNFDITGVQLEAGAVATPFEFEDFGTTLRKCQRYFQTYVDPPLRGVADNTTRPGRMGMVLPVRMRVAPTSYSFSGSLLFWEGNTSGSYISTQSAYLSATTAEFDFNLNVGYTLGRAVVLYQGGGGTMTLSSEL